MKQPFQKKKLFSSVSPQIVRIFIISAIILIAEKLIERFIADDFSAILFTLSIAGSVGVVISALGILLELLGRKDDSGLNNSQEDQGKPPMEAKTAPVRSESDQYLLKIQQLNNKISGKEISDIIDQIKERSRKIFAYVQRNPDHVEETERFMNYYLPTTLKLMEQYYEFDSSGLMTKDVIAAKEKIETTLKSLVHSYEKLLESLLLNKAMDISGEIAVLEHRLLMDGYKKSDFEMQ